MKVAATRQQMFFFVGYRTPTIQRLRLGAAEDGTLQAISHEATMQTSHVREFAEQTAICSRWMYEAPNRRTGHRLVALDVPTPSWLRAPGECPGMYALESAMDELAYELGMDPVELRIHNDPELAPETGQRFSSRNLVACLREGAERFGWAGRDPTPGARRDGVWLHGTGVASSTYPAYQQPSSATARAEADGTFLVRIASADIGTGARTVLTQIAADALGAPLERVRVEVGDSVATRRPAWPAARRAPRRGARRSRSRAARCSRSSTSGDAPGRGVGRHEGVPQEPRGPRALRVRRPVRRRARELR